MIVSNGSNRRSRKSSLTSMGVAATNTPLARRSNQYTKFPSLDSNRNFSSPRSSMARRAMFSSSSGLDGSEAISASRLFSAFTRASYASRF